MITKIMIMCDGSFALVRGDFPILYLSTKWLLEAVIEAARFGFAENCEIIKYFEN
jgi:hypothetical protein